MYRKRPWAMIACSSSSSSRRRRRMATAAAAATPEPDASSLQGDLVRLIGWRVLAGDLLDYVRFRAVCPHWRSSTVCPRGRGVVDPRRWMMLPEGHGLYPGHNKLRGYIRFFNLSTGLIVRTPLPFFGDHCVLDSVERLLLLQRDQDTAILLIHPFTGDITELPPLVVTLARRFFPRFSPEGDDLDTEDIGSNLERWCLAFATIGDQQWNVASWTLSRLRKPISFQGMGGIQRLSSLDNWPGFAAARRLPSVTSCGSSEGQNDEFIRVRRRDSEFAQALKNFCLRHCSKACYTCWIIKDFLVIPL